MQSKKVKFEIKHKIITNFSINSRDVLSLKTRLSIINTIKQWVYFDIKLWKEFSKKIYKSYQTYYWIHRHGFYLISVNVL